MRNKTILITGAAGEIGHALLTKLAETGPKQILTLDLSALSAEMNSHSRHFQGSIIDEDLVKGLFADYSVDVIFHLAALLSTSAERKPALAQQVNVGGTALLLEQAAAQTLARGTATVFLYPSSIAAYGLPDLETKTANPNVSEEDFLWPATMYGVNKLYGELLGEYYARHYMRLADERPVMVDFRAVRFPGLISAFTVPSGGTSDYGPEMLHTAVKGEPYACFVRPDTTIPFMAMPDGVKALLDLATADRGVLNRTAYNVGAFSLSANDFRLRVLAAFPDAEITFAPDELRQAIVDSWPADVDDSAARRDWHWSPDLDEGRAFDDYLVPNIRERYAG